MSYILFITLSGRRTALGTYSSFAAHLLSSDPVCAFFLLLPTYLGLRGFAGGLCR
jgi:hypothetical protein